MDTHSDKSRSWIFPASPTSVKLTNSGTSSTFQATTHLGTLHVFVSAVDCMLEGGTGSSVTVTTGMLLKAGVPWYFTPVTGRESLGYKTLSGSAFSAADVATVARVPAAAVS